MILKFQNRLFQHVLSPSLQHYSNGDLHLSLRYSTNKEQIQGVVLKASNLPRPHTFGLAGNRYSCSKGEREGGREGRKEGRKEGGRAVFLE